MVFLLEATVMNYDTPKGLYFIAFIQIKCKWQEKMRSNMKDET